MPRNPANVAVHQNGTSEKCLPTPEPARSIEEETETEERTRICGGRKCQVVSDEEGKGHSKCGGQGATTEMEKCSSLELARREEDGKESSWNRYRAGLGDKLSTFSRKITNNVRPRSPPPSTR